MDESDLQEYASFVWKTCTPGELLTPSFAVVMFNLVKCNKTEKSIKIAKKSFFLFELSITTLHIDDRQSTRRPVHCCALAGDTSIVKAANCRAAPRLAYFL